MRTGVQLAVALVSVLLSWSVGCSDGTGYRIGPQGERHVGVEVYADGEVAVRETVVAPVNLAVWVSVNGASLLQAAGGYAQLADRVEIQLQDNGQWIDVTTPYKEHWWDEATFIDYRPSRLYEVTLTEPRTYVIVARVEFFDGVIVQTGPFQSPTITVTAAEGGQ